jgi:hypothetical protein
MEIFQNKVSKYPKENSHLLIIDNLLFQSMAPGIKRDVFNSLVYADITADPEDSNLHYIRPLMAWPPLFSRMLWVSVLT